MSERQRYGDGHLREIYSHYDFRVEEITLPPGGSTGDRTHFRSHIGTVFEGRMILYKQVGNGNAFERLKEGDNFIIEYGRRHRIEAGEDGVKIIQTSIKSVS